MQPSFFQKNSFKIIERLIVEEKFVLEEKNEILSAYDFSAWKLSPNTVQIQINSLSSQEESMREMKEKHASPFGICITTVDEIQVAAKYANFLYIPGEFCRQSDVLESAKMSQLPLVVEKGVFLSPNDIKRLCEKIHGADYALVECGSSNGYSDSVLDPRSLSLMKKNSCSFGVSLSDLLAPEGVHYSYRPQWLNNSEFIEAFISTSKAFNASFFVTKNHGHGKLSAESILKMVK